MSDTGCLYVAFGRPYLIQALNSIRTLRSMSPTIPVCVLTNTLPTAPPTFSEWDHTNDHWAYLERSDRDNRSVKTDLLRYTPFSRTLYLDCDTEVVSDIAPMFRFLEHWDIAVRLKEEGYAPAKEKGRQIVLDGAAAVHELPHWNSGVILFASNPRVEEFFELWQHYYQIGTTSYDQVSLVEAVFRSSARILSLDARWNAGIRWGIERPDQQRFIVHYMHTIDDRLADTLISLDKTVYGDQSVTNAAQGMDTVSFVATRRRVHALKKQPRHASIDGLQVLRRAWRKLKTVAERCR